MYSSVDLWLEMLCFTSYIYIYWSYENRVTKHFVIFLNSPCLIACLLRCLLMSFFFACFKWLGNCVEVDVDSITILPTPLPPYFSPPTILFV